MLRFVLFAAILPLSSFAEPCPEGQRQYRTTLRHIESGGLGYDHGYTTLEAFFASDPSQWAVTPFLDVRGHVFDNGKWAANAGIGLRALWQDCAFGINTYYDYRNTGRLNSNQIGVGLEALSEGIDFRINGYFPFGRKTSAPYDAVFKAFSGHHMILWEKIHSAMTGTDAELGFHFGKSEKWDFYGAIGPYYFIGKSTPTTWGGKARLSGTYKDLCTLEISDSYDGTFHNQFQGQIGLTFSFGPKTKVKEQGRTCKLAHTLNKRMLQPVGRQEIIVIDKPRKSAVAIDPATGLPYFFVFIDNTSSSNGTYESPYHSFAQAQSNSSPNDIIYVFPGDGTTTGMASGIALKPSQQLLGSGISHSLPTSLGAISIPAQSSASPTITNTDVDTELNAVTLSTNNTISGITISSPLNDAIYGTNPQNLTVSSCTFTDTTTYPIEATFPGAASISITNNQFLNNGNGIFLTLNGTSTVACSNNTFSGQSSVSSIPLEISANNNTFTAQIENNVFNANTTGGIKVNLNTVVSGNITVQNNTLSNNTAGAAAQLGSAFVIALTAATTTQNCSITLANNSFSTNASNALYMHTDGVITNLSVTASGNTMSNNGGSALALATPVTTLTLLATDNTITSCNDNAISVIASGTSTTGTITINNNTITDIGNASNGIAVNQGFTNLALTISNNNIDTCEGTGILSYAGSEIDSLTLTVSGNTISNCENMSSNAASGLDIEQFTTLAGSVTNNTLSGNLGTAVAIGSTLTAPSACLTLSGNTSSNYSLTNPGDGTFNLSPCNVDTVNTGTINTSGAITSVQSCPDASPCP
jgi:hypothetical protein